MTGPAGPDDPTDPDAKPGAVRDPGALPRRWRRVRSARQERHPAPERRPKRERPDRGADIEDLLGPAEPTPQTEDEPVPDGSMLRDEGPWQHRDISANGIRFHIAEAGSGPLIVLMHGFGQYWRSWRYQLPGLARAGFRVVAPDLRGYGDSDKTPRGYDAFTLADDIAGLVRSLGERDAVLVGHGLRRGDRVRHRRDESRPGPRGGGDCRAASHPDGPDPATRADRPVRAAAGVGGHAGVARTSSGRRQRRAAGADRAVPIRARRGGHRWISPRRWSRCGRRSGFRERPGGPSNTCAGSARSPLPHRRPSTP